MQLVVTDFKTVCTYIHKTICVSSDSLDQVNIRKYGITTSATV